MRKPNVLLLLFICVIFILPMFFSCGGKTDTAAIESAEAGSFKETRAEKDQRMAWWREARFGLFIHWGLYAVPAGEWKGATNHAEWILTTAQIPVVEYEKFAPRFNPVKFDAAAWVSAAKRAGMKYIVITSKHHDGFCLFDSAQTDYDVMDATPFKRDILKELSEECEKQGIRLCFYHSIMDWHHPDYLPRRRWEDRSAEGADFDRYVEYMKAQVKELVTNYGDIGVLWFDGEWEATWTPERGLDLYNYVRGLKPDIIINNRVGKGRAGMAGTFDPEEATGDFGTPEQEIPATGLGYDWETCMTMNDHWGYNKNDDHWKSTTDLIQKLADIASKGGNFLLNVGPTAEGLFPPESMERLEAMGRWMDVNGESITGTTASLFENLPWGRSTTDRKGGALYLHVFDWPDDGLLQVPGLLSPASSVSLLASPGVPLDISYSGGQAVIDLPLEAPDPYDSVIKITFDGAIEVVRSPEITAEGDIFTDSLDVILSGALDTAAIRYTTDGTDPTPESPLFTDSITLEDTAEVRCQIYRDGQAVSAVVSRSFSKVQPRPAETPVNLQAGLSYRYFQGDWENLPDFSSLEPEEDGTTPTFSLDPGRRPEKFALLFRGYIQVPVDGVYHFFLVSDDGSRLWIGDTLVVDNDGLHGSAMAEGRIALAAGDHSIRVGYFQGTGGAELEAGYSGPGIEKQKIPFSVLFTN